MYMFMHGALFPWAHRAIACCMVVPCEQASQQLEPGRHYVPPPWLKPTDVRRQRRINGRWGADPRRSRALARGADGAVLWRGAGRAPGECVYARRACTRRRPRSGRGRGRLIGVSGLFFSCVSGNPGPGEPRPLPIARPGVAGADRTPSGGSPVRRQVHPTSGAAAGRRRCTITFVVSRPSFPLVGAACLVARGATRSPGHSGKCPSSRGGAKPRASFLRGPSRPEGPRASRWCVAPLRGPHARRLPPTRVSSSPLRGAPSDCVRWVGTGALARRATALRSAARCAGSPRSRSARWFADVPQIIPFIPQTAAQSRRTLAPTF